MSPRRAFLLLVTVFLISTLPFRSLAEDKAMLGIDQMIYVEVNKQNCQVELYLNGIPVARALSNQDFASVPAHGYLVDGKNEIEMVINPGPTPSQSRTAKRELDSTGAQAVARLVKYPVGVYPGDDGGEVLGIVEWKGQDRKEIFPKSVLAKIELGPMFGRWQWQDAEQVVLDKKTLNEISAYVKKFYAAFSASKGQEILNLAHVRLEEGYKTYPGENSTQENALFLRDVEERKQNKHWKVAPLRPAQFDFRIHANGRMVAWSK